MAAASEVLNLKKWNFLRSHDGKKAEKNRRVVT
jgi:hypothetical protein